MIHGDRDPRLLLEAAPAPVALVVSAPVALVFPAPVALVFPVSRAVITVAQAAGGPGTAFPVGGDDGGRGRGKARLAGFVGPSHFHHRRAWIACGEATVCRK